MLPGVSGTWPWAKLLERVQRAGADVAIDHADGAQRQREQPERWGRRRNYSQRGTEAAAAHGYGILAQRRAARRPPALSQCHNGRCRSRRPRHARSVASGPHRTGHQVEAEQPALDGPFHIGTRRGLSFRRIVPGSLGSGLSAGRPGLVRAGGVGTLPVRGQAREEIRRRLAVLGRRAVRPACPPAPGCARHTAG